MFRKKTDIVQKERKPGVKSAKSSTQTEVQQEKEEGSSNESFGEEMPPITSHITENIIINRSFGERNKSVLDGGVQTDAEMFFVYIFDFLNELEKRISSGDISVEDIVNQGKDALGLLQSKISLKKQV